MASLGRGASHPVSPDPGSSRETSRAAMKPECPAIPPDRAQVARCGRWSSWLLLGALWLGLSLGSAGAGEPGLKPVTLMPLWSPQAQFAGYYVAIDQGIYARHGIDLRMLRAGPGISPAEALTNGTADFAVLWLTTALRHRDRGEPVVHLAQFVQRSSILLVSRKSSGIRSIADMEGRKVGMWGGDLSIPPNALFAREGVRVREVPQAHTINLFLRGGIEVASAMWYNEYHTIYSSGVDAGDLNVVFLSEQGLNFPEDGLYALEGTVRRDPALASSFVAATLEGWRRAFEKPDLALDSVLRRMREARIPANRVHQQWMLARMEDLLKSAGSDVRLGELRTEDFRSVTESLLRLGLIRAAPDPAAFLWRSHAGKE